jgi:enoyl-CoA hydratase
MGDVHYETDGPVAIITIDRPEVRNAIDRPTAEALADAFRGFDRDASLNVAVLTGANGIFCAGADLKAIVDGRGNRVAEDGDGPVGVSRLLLSKPTVAAVEGHAVAGGLEVALWCDLRVAAEDAVFGVFCRRWGIPLMDGGTVRLARLIGHSHALDMILTGRSVAGEEALRMGLANRLVPKGMALQAAIALARDIAKFPQHALRSDRLSSYEQWPLTLEDALRGEFHHGMEVVQSGGMFAGLETFAKTAGRHGTLRHVVLGTPMLPPFPPEMETAMFAMGRFWGAERRFWQADGVYTTATGYAGGHTSGPTHDAVRAGDTGHAEVVRVVFDPRQTSFEAMLRLFWEGHDPTQGMRQGDDVGTQYRSGIYWFTAAQRRAAETSRDTYQRALSAAGRGTITTEILDAPEFHYAEDAQQQYLAKNPGGYGGLVGTGVRYPTGLAPDAPAHPS